MSNNEDWNAYRIKIVSDLERIESKLDTVLRKQVELDLQFAVIKARAALIGAFAGAVIGIVQVFIEWMKS